jgi:HPr kinase/phosphorylase
MVQQTSAITVERFYMNHADALHLTLLAGASGLTKRIHEGSVNRPGLALAGFYKYFAYKRVQVIGSAEVSYLNSLSRATRATRIRKLFNSRIPCVVFARNSNPPQEALMLAEQRHTAVFKSPMITMLLINAATIRLEMEFAPTTVEHGTMLDIMGIGVLIRGESGVGKSECGLGLIERGYSLVADDSVKLRLMEGRELSATCPETTRFHMEVRGLGVINIAAVFGVAAIRQEKRVDMVVTLKEWDKTEEMERAGLDSQQYNILGIDLPHVILPVRPGRDLARLVEVAALDQKLKSAGHNSAKEFNERLIARMKSNATF